MIEVFVSVGYSLIEASWTAAAMAIKYYLAFTVFRLSMDEKLDLPSFEEKVLEESATVVTAVFVFGALMLVTGVNSDPVLKFFSELTALAYLGFLFWKF